MSVVDIGVLSVGSVAVALTVAYAMLRTGRGDPLERMAAWARTHHLDYVAPERDNVLATFVGERDGYRVEVMVERVARGFGSDLSTRVTTVTVGPARVPQHVALEGTTVFTLQPAAWVKDKYGQAVGDRVPTGDEVFDAKWSVRGADASAMRRSLSPPVRARLTATDAEGLIIEITTGVVAIPMPGVCADARELDRRLGLADALARLLLDH